MDRKQTVDGFIECQRKEARGMRLEMLEKDLYGTRILLLNVALPVFKSLEGFVLEHEILSQTGVKIYADIYYGPLRLILECEGYVPHVEKITRERHDFEQSRVRSFAAMRCIYIPFSRDEIEKKPEACRRSLYEIIGESKVASGNKLEQLVVNERELLRLALHNQGMFSFASARECLGLCPNTTRKNLRSLQARGLLDAVGTGKQRHRYYRISEEGRGLFC